MPTALPFPIILGVTGHRDVEPEQQDAVRTTLVAVLTGLYAQFGDALHLMTALADGADVVLTGRVADPSLYLAPLVHEFGWPLDDWDLMGKGICVGHLLECAGQVTGGYFADPGVKDVPDLARLGFPIAKVAADGSFSITKVPGSGGRVTVRTCTEQLLYEVHDPRRLRVRGRGGGLFRRGSHPGRPGRGRGHRRHRRPAPGHAQGLGWLP